MAEEKAEVVTILLIILASVAVAGGLFWLGALAMLGTIFELIDEAGRQ